MECKLYNIGTPKHKKNVPVQMVRTMMDVKYFFSITESQPRATKINRRDPPNAKLTKYIEKFETNCKV